MANGNGNEKEITIYDIAKRLKISPATVSRALQDHPRISAKTKKKIFDLADEVGYRRNHFAGNLRAQKTQTIGVIVPRLNSHFMSSVIAGIELTVNEHGYSLLISQSSESVLKEADSAEAMFNSRVDGLMASLAYDTSTLDHFDKFFRKKTPVIFFDRVMPNKNATSILIDNYRAAYDATKHLIEQGCKKILHITAPQMQNVYRDRLAGYKSALEEAKLKFREDHVIITNLSQEAGYEQAARILKMKSLPDGIFVANDSCAIGCMMGLMEKGIRIPEQVAFVGFNNDPVSTVIDPKLTTIAYSGFEMGEVAGRLLVNHLNGTLPINNTTTIVLRSDLIVRQSSMKNQG
ncbi:LacI family transcriptional regulator [Chitinophaga agrisoli]|uniref:LacI family transcriptional regulator n=1 Tax=Chitinophaga agrisoli TaxID=2607653 RepID=A0A5B2VKI7_9BACT|nr:LacI family DNA-binding transcriptional regulator [Chitinophaga agrisoli]KAA2239591.1 LacI family transcriptional regulator [Chitinophaga agrisoli]